MPRRNMNFANQPDPRANLDLAWQVFHEHEFTAHDLFSQVVLGLDQDPANSGEGEEELLVYGDEFVAVRPYEITYRPVDLRPALGIISRLLVVSSRFAVMHEAGQISTYSGGEHSGESEITSVHGLDVHEAIGGPAIESFIRPGIAIRFGTSGGLVDEYFEPTPEEAVAERYGPPPSPARLAEMQVEQYRFAGYIGAVGFARGLEPPRF